jgi:hypothetical protein
LILANIFFRKSINSNLVFSPSTNTSSKRKREKEKKTTRKISQERRRRMKEVTHE